MICAQVVKTDIGKLVLFLIKSSFVTNEKHFLTIQIKNNSPIPY